MRYALIIAGGSGTRLWPMSTKKLPKQLIPFIDGKSLLEVAIDRLKGLLPEQRIYVCAGEAHRQVILQRVPGMTAERFIAEPTGRDTLNAVALGTGVIAKHDPQAVVAIFTADHLIEPVEPFQQVVAKGYALAEARENVLVTFGIEPTFAATGYGYLELGEAIEGSGASIVKRFKEKPDASTAERYVQAGPGAYLWNSGMFVWRAATLWDCVQRFSPENAVGLARVFQAWGTAKQEAVLNEVYPGLKKISVDYAVMEPASADEKVQVAAIPMPLRWLDVGSWPAFGETRENDEAGNATAGGKTLLMDTSGSLVVSDEAEHLVATIGCEDLIVIHTKQATLVCRKDQAEKIKQLHKEVGEKLGDAWL